MIKAVSKVTLEDTPADIVYSHATEQWGRECDPVQQSAHVFDHQLRNGSQKIWKFMTSLAVF